MKTRFHGFSSSRSFAKLLLSAFLFVALGVPGLSSALPLYSSGGGISGGYKTVINNHDLICDLNDSRSTAVIEVTLPPEDPSFRFGAKPGATPVTALDPTQGQMFCYEVLHGTTTPTGDAGLFTLIQVRSENGLERDICIQGDSSCADGGPVPDGNPVTKRTTFIYKIKSGGQNNENLLYRLVPADLATQNTFCSGITFCGANIGLDEHNAGTFITSGTFTGIYDGGGNGEKGSDYPARDVTGDTNNDLQNTEVYRFTIETEGGIDKPKNFFFGPCHNGGFNLTVAVACQFTIDRVVKATTVKGDVQGVLIVPIDLQADNATNSSLNMGQQAGTYPVAIVGTTAVPVSTGGVLNFDVATGAIFVNGQPPQGLVVARTTDPPVDVTSPNSQGTLDGIPDLVVYFSRASFVNAVLASFGGHCVNGSRVTLTLNGTLSDGVTQWQGSDVVTLTNCP
jgi:hypothetical protein